MAKLSFLLIDPGLVFLWRHLTLQDGYEKYRLLLEEEARKHNITIEGLKTVPDGHDHLDIANAKDIQEISSILTTARTLVARLIKLALQRMKDGEYGLCLCCEQPIPAKRLEAVSYSPFCGFCQVKVNEGRIADLKGCKTPLIGARDRETMSTLRQQA